MDKTIYFVYILQNVAGRMYIGQTNDLARRLTEHNSGSHRFAFTSKKGPWILILHEEYSTRSEAMNRERYLKTGKGRLYLKQIMEGAST